jgi:hypothetical protein
MSIQHREIAANEAQLRWPAGLQRELEDNLYNGTVGSILVSETEKLRVWHLRLPVGKRCTFHRHVLDYFWTAHTPGAARAYCHDGCVVDVTYYAGETKHFKFDPGDFFIHSVENIGDTELIFTTVEFLDSANDPLPLPDGIRLEHTA